MKPFVKQERSDEAEIQELAAQMIEANRVKMQTPRPNNTAPTNNNGGILNFITRVNKATKADANTITLTSQVELRSLGDEESVRGRFGWTSIGKNDIPYIFRSGEEYCAVRIIEMKVLNKYLTYLHQDIYNCTCIRSYYITESECRLLNEINIKHCDSIFGRDQFTVRDLIVRLSDALEFYNFLDSCYNKLVNGVNNPLDRCGFIRINKESVVPYTLYNTRKYVPLFYFEGETENLKLRADKLEGWDLSYLKFCCKVQGIRNELFAHDSCAVISLNDITNYFPPGTLFEDYWPSKVVDSQLLINGKNQSHVAQWIRQPAGPPVAHPPASPKPATQAKPVTNNHNMPAHVPMYTNYPVPAGQGGYSLQARPVAPAARPYASSVVPRQARPSAYYMTPVAPVQTPAPPPPPLIRGNQAPSTYRGTPVPPNFMMLEPAPGFRPAGVNAHKFPPPPLIPMAHHNGDIRYESPPNHYRSPTDIVDLSGNNRLLPHSTNSNNMLPVHQSLINQQPAHQQTNRVPQEEHSNIPNGRMHTHRKLIAIADTPTSGNHIPYKIQKALIDGRMVPCINMKPYVYTDLLVTIPDLVEQLFNNIPIHSCHQVIHVLGIDLYKGNSSQMRVLYDTGKCQSMTDIVPLVPVRLVLEFMPQLKYMLGGLVTSEVASKRQRTS